MNSKRLSDEHVYQIGIAIGKLIDRLEMAKAELRKAESRTGKGYRLRAINRLRDEIESLERRIQRAERMQDENKT